jgi:glycosyltransferase involved in cell wall biosynthesis
VKIAFVGPISTDSVADLIQEDRSGLPSGYFGAPLMGTLIKELLARGHSVTAVTTSPDLPPHSSAGRIASGQNFKLHYVPVRKKAFSRSGGQWGRAADLFRMERRALASVVSSAHPEIVHAHWSYEFALAAIDTGIPHVITCHDAPQVVLRYSPDLYRLARYAMARGALRNAQSLTAVSPYLASKIEKYCSAEIRIVPNPIPQSSVVAVAKHSVTDPQRPKVAAVLNGWGKRKNPEVAFRAFQTVRAELPDAEFHVVGQGYGPGEQADRWVRSNGLERGVLLHGRQDYQSLMRLLAGMDVLIHPSLEETFGMSIAEAMALGVVVVGGEDSGAVPDVLDGGRCGMLVDVRSSEAISTAVLRVLKSPELYEQLSTSAAAKVKTSFSPSSVVSSYESAYMEALRSQSRHSARPVDDLSGTVRRRA